MKAILLRRSRAHDLRHRQVAGIYRPASIDCPVVLVNLPVRGQSLDRLLNHPAVFVLRRLVDNNHFDVSFEPRVDDLMSQSVPGGPDAVPVLSIRNGNRELRPAMNAERELRIQSHLPFRAAAGFTT